MNRCEWCGEDELYIKYHDEEWGKPNHDDKIHFEFLILESAQAGLSWITILRKRENYRKAYDNFDPIKIAKYDEKKIEKLLKNEGIIRNKRKIEASINNAQRFLEVQKEFGSFDKYIWSFTKGEIIKNSWNSLKEVPANTELSDLISQKMKKRGFKFIGTTIIYSYLQAIGIINDHLISCFKYNEG